MECGFSQSDYKPEKVYEDNAHKYDLDSEYSKNCCITSLGSCCTCCIFCGALTMLIIGLIWAMTQKDMMVFDPGLHSDLTVTFSEPGMEFVSGLIVWQLDPRASSRRSGRSTIAQILGSPYRVTH